MLNVCIDVLAEEREAEEEEQQQQQPACGGLGEEGEGEGEESSMMIPRHGPNLTKVRSSGSGHLHIGVGR